MLSSRCIEKKQAMLCRTNKKICDTKLLELHRCETREVPRSLIFVPHGYGFHEPQIRLWVTDELKVNHRRDWSANPKRQEMMAKLARKVWEMPERSGEAAE